MSHLLAFRADADKLADQGLFGVEAGAKDILDEFSSGQCCFCSLVLGEAYVLSRAAGSKRTHNDERHLR